MGHRSKSRHSKSKSKSRPRRSSRRNLNGYDYDYDYQYYQYHDHNSRQSYIYGGSESETSYLQEQQLQQQQQQQQQLQLQQQQQIQQYDPNLACEYASSQIQYHQYPTFPLYAGETCPMCFTVLEKDQQGPCIQGYCTIPYQVPKPPPSHFYEKNPYGRNPFERPTTPGAPAVYCTCIASSASDYNNAGEQDPQFGFQGYYSQEQTPYPAFVVHDQDIKDQQQNPPQTSQSSQQEAAGIPPNSDEYHKLAHQMMVEAACQCQNCECTLPPPGSQQNEAAYQSCNCQNCQCTINEQNTGNPSSVSKSNQNAEKSSQISTSTVVENSKNDPNGSLKFDPNFDSNLQGADNGSLAEQTADGKSIQSGQDISENSKISSASKPVSTSPEKPGETGEKPGEAKGGDEAQTQYSFTEVKHDYQGPSEDFIDGDEEDRSVGSSSISFPSLGSSTSTLQGDGKSSTKSSKSLKKSKK